ncbi:GntR family transcriptional regulator [Treponema pedis]|uniref:GntR family transcriptional regulator n=1 Tax=Treponema pedis TaxID=409322 RepID=UPI00041C5326|nr:GntR family transcriptional regulator [Treponema pedis]
MKVEYDQNRPIYLQIIEKIKYKIIDGEIAPGERLLSMSDMAVEMDVNPNTMFRVYRDLEAQGVTFSQRGLGSYVVYDSDIVKKLSNEMAEDILNTAIEGLKKIKFSDSQIIEAVTKKLT